GSSSFTWAVTGPVINSLSPTSAVEGTGPLTLTINGAGFQTGASTVNVNGTALIPTGSTSTQLTVTVPASLVLEDGTDTVTVSVPDGSGSPSTPLVAPARTFPVTKASVLRVAYANQSTLEGNAVSVGPATYTDRDASSFSVSGLPTGLTINSATGVISG